MMDILQEFIREIEKHKVADIARNSGISRFTIYDWISGKTVPTLVNAQKVANAMGLEFLLFNKREE